MTVEEMKVVVDEMKNNKSPGEDGIPTEAIKFGGDILFDFVTNNYD